MLVFHTHLKTTFVYDRTDTFNFNVLLILVLYQYLHFVLLLLNAFDSPLNKSKFHFIFYSVLEVSQLYL